MPLAWNYETLHFLMRELAICTQRLSKVGVHSIGLGFILTSGIRKRCIWSRPIFRSNSLTLIRYEHSVNRFLYSCFHWVIYTFIPTIRTSCILRSDIVGSHCERVTKSTIKNEFCIWIPKYMLRWFFNFRYVDNQTIKPLRVHSKYPDNQLISLQGLNYALHISR